MRRTIWALGAAVTLAAVGCGGHSGAAGTTSTTATATSTSSATTEGVASTVPSPTAPPTTTINTSVVPAVITIPYVNAVLAQLNHVYGNAVRLVVQTRTIPPAAVADLQAIYSGQQYNDELRIFSIQLVDGIKQIKDDPGDRVFSVEKLLRVKPTCISVEASGDYDALSIAPVQMVTTFIVLMRLSSLDVNGTNPTTWSFVYEMANPPGPSFCV